MRCSRPRNPDMAVFQRLAKDFQRLARELRELVEEQDASVSQRNFTRDRSRSAAQEAYGRHSVVWSSEWAPSHETLSALFHPGNGMDTRYFQRLFYA